MARSIVADASVIVKFFIKELYSEDAQRLLDAFINNEIILIEPSLLNYEILNALKYSEAGKFGMDKIKVIFSALENYGFINVDLSNTFADKAIMISFKNNISFYDAVYVALALNMNADLYTADEKLIKLAHNQHVRHIKDFK